MKSLGNHIIYIVVLVFTGMLVYLPCSAQDSNMRYWENQKQKESQRLSQVTVDFKYIFRSRVVNDSTLKAIRDCHIINKTQKMGTVSDAYGDFKITANVNDSISFSALGYEKLTIALTDSMFNYGYIIKLKPKVYELGEITVQPYQLDLLPIHKSEIYTPPLPNQGGINLLPVDVSPITYLYNLYSKEGKQKRYHKKITDGTADFMLIGEKFNGKMVAHITGLKDDELIKFMSFCNFSNDFLINYSPETIKKAIKKKYQEYMGE